MAVISSTLATLIAQVRQTADQESGGLCTDAEITTYINFALAEMTDIAIEAYGEEWLTVSGPMSLTAGQGTYPLPSDFYKLRALIVTDHGGKNRELRRAGIHDIANIGNLPKGMPVAYRVIGSTVEVVPKPEASYTGAILYVSASAVLVNGTDVLPTYGWEMLVVLEAAKRCARKEENYELVDRLEQDKQATIARVRRAAAMRDAANPDTVRDVRGYDIDPDDLLVSRWGA